MFEAIQGAYEILLPVLESGQALIFSSTPVNGDQELARNDNSADGFAGGRYQMQKVLLLLKAQLLICKRYEKEMSRYKYPAYRMLLSCLNMPTSCTDAGLNSDPTNLFESCLLTSKRAQFVAAAVELLFQTCLVSPLNAEELVSEGGVSILEPLLDFYVHAGLHFAGDHGPNSATSETVATIIAHIVHTIAGVAFYETGRAAISTLSSCSRLCVNLRRCVDGRSLFVGESEGENVLIKKFALEGVVRMAKAADLQVLLVGSGILWPLTRLLLGYDPTLEESSTYSDDHDDIAISQAACNTLARLSTRALGSLCGLLTDPQLSTPRNDVIIAAMARLLTEPVARMLRNKRTGAILRTLNSNIETPARIWNVKMRRELDAVLSKMERESNDEECRPVDVELNPLLSFEFSTLRDELSIGGVYIRVLINIGGTSEALREIHNASDFARELIYFIAGCMNASGEHPEEWAVLDLGFSIDEQKRRVPSVPISDPRFLMALEALRLLVRAEGIIDEILADKTSDVSSFFLSLLELPQDSPVSIIKSLSFWPCFVRSTLFFPRFLMSRATFLLL